MSARLARVLTRLVVEPVRHGPAQLIEASRQTGKPVSEMLREVRSLRRYRIGGREYIKYRLFDDSRYSPQQKREYTGLRFQESVYRTINDPGLVGQSGLQASWDGQVDKVLFDMVMRANGLPTPELAAVYDTDAPVYRDVETLSSAADVAGFVRASESPLFVKPARAHSGIGALRIREVRGEDVDLADGRTLPVSQVVGLITRRPRALLQRVVNAHSVLSDVVGVSALPTVRVVVLRRPKASVIHRAVLRIPAGSSVVDNYHGGESANFAAGVDIATGVVGRAYRGWGVSQVRQPLHPDTGAQIEGLQLPDWREGVDLLLAASRVFPGVRLQSWDLALGSGGPIIIELNDKSAQDVLQVAGPPGMLDAQLADFLREHKVAWPYPA